MACCRIDSLHTGETKGSIQTVNSIEVYITLPNSRDVVSSLSATSTALPNKKWSLSLLLLTEVHGIALPNSKLLADKFASALNCPVIVPDLFDADPMPVVKPEGWDASRGLADFQIRHHPGTVEPILEAVMEWMQRSEAEGGLGGVQSLGAVGYCFGGRYIFRMLADRKIDAGVVNHPSFFTIEEVKALRTGTTVRGGLSPIAIFAAETDDIFPEAKRRETEDILKKIGAAWWCSTFAGTQHSFSIRGDLSDRKVRFAAESALNGAIIWFKEFLSKKMINSSWPSRILQLGAIGAGTSVAAFFIGTKHCEIVDPLDPQSEPLFKSSWYKLYNPHNNKPLSDACVRKIPLRLLKYDILLDAKNGGPKLVESFAQGCFGGYTSTASTSEVAASSTPAPPPQHLWTQSQLLSSHYTPGTIIANHFLVLSHTPTSILVRCGASPFDSPSSPRASDGLFEFSAVPDFDKGYVEFRMTSLFFNGQADEWPEGKEVMGASGKWLHQQYAKLWMENAIRNCRMSKFRSQRSQVEIAKEKMTKEKEERG
ncbi:hypothetical protein DV736_g2955, partial [Chaetothyriales sp. CBS 134916]